MQIKPKALFFDLDGTLVDKKPYISAENKQAIIELNKNIPCFISTGRGFSKNLVNLTNELGLDYGIAQNGAIIFDKTGNIIKKYTLKENTVKNICEYLAKRKVPFILNSSRTIYCNSTISKMFPLFKNEYIISSPSKIQNYSDVTKILIFSFSKRKLQKIQSELLELEININVLMTGNNKALEINDKNASKGNANAFICSLKNIDPMKTYHIGDSMNDSTAVYYQGGVIAMKNASQELKNMAIYVGFNYKKSGVARTLDKILK
ncbi:Cof-type HAD-IIB family hydrolase [[Mycoplasma] gypis]|uniref:Cof-type HAD-IIB family hydrolase n=1 Tax=[Mycoplasma] gypis TaxID=92404 RepID=A0ABZ2RQW0_9BACT|nr:Cof-type HAD-IIB family hydrolase [[Mycoplasma] gypis]MBN0919629.1 Cof-type HAD-IIB family hydrolase [[Mycoplasma] gypis]